MQRRFKVLGCPFSIWSFEHRLYLVQAPSIAWPCIIVSFASTSNRRCSSQNEKITIWGKNHAEIIVISYHAYASHAFWFLWWSNMVVSTTILSHRHERKDVSTIKSVNMTDDRIHFALNKLICHWFFFTFFAHSSVKSVSFTVAICLIWKCVCLFESLSWKSVNVKPGYQL